MRGNALARLLLRCGNGNCKVLFKDYGSDQDKYLPITRVQYIVEDNTIYLSYKEPTKRKRELK